MLKEKLFNAIFDNAWEFKTENVVPECEKIADDYAIEFAEWLHRWDNTRLPNGNWIIGLGLKAYTSEEVLVKFKKEKGL